MKQFMAVFVTLVTLLMSAAGHAQETVEVGAQASSSTTSKSRTLTLAGQVVDVNQEVYVPANSWGKTHLDALAEEQRWIAKGRQQKGGLTNHSARIDGRTTRRLTLDDRYEDGEPIKGFNRRWTVNMVHRMQGGKNSWVIGWVEPEEILIGKRVGHHEWATMLADGRVRYRVVDVYDVNSCFRCDNPTEGMVYIEYKQVRTVPVIVEKERTETRTTFQVPSQSSTVYNVTNITLMTGQGPGPQMTPATVYHSAPLAPVYFYRTRSGRCKMICPIGCPGNPPTLPPPPPPPPIGTPPNNDPNYPNGTGNPLQK